MKTAHDDREGMRSYGTDPLNVLEKMVLRTISRDEDIHYSFQQTVLFVSWDHNDVSTRC